MEPTSMLIHYATKAKCEKAIEGAEYADYYFAFKDGKYGWVPQMKHFYHKNKAWQLTIEQCREMARMSKEACA